MNTLEKAITFAIKRHAGSVRKVTGIPYIVHPLEVVSIAAGITSDNEILAAAALHDVVEDTTTELIEIEALFGKNIAALTAANSEEKIQNVPPVESWLLRKEAKIRALRSATLDVKIIALADKLSNIRSIHQDSFRLGDKIWDKFNQRNKKMHEWYYRSTKEEFTIFSECIAYKELSRLINVVFD